MKGNNLVNLADFRKKVEEITQNATQSSIEEKLDMDAKELNRIYSGRQALTVDHLLKLSAAYGCSIDYLLTGSREAASRIAPAAAPSYPDLIRCLDALVSNGLAEIVDYKTGETEAYQTASGEWEEAERIMRALAFNDTQLSSALYEYREITLLGSLLKTKFKELWLKEKLEKDFPLTKEGMRDMLNDF